MDLFVFGTLLHLPLLEVVSGDPEIADKRKWAARPAFSVHRVQGQVFPVLHPDPDGVAEGVIISGLDEEALARLDYYETAFGYDRAEFNVLDAEEQSHRVFGYLPKPGKWHVGPLWDRQAWTSIYGEVTTLTAREAMEAMGQIQAEEMAVRYPGMMARAASRLRAAQEIGAKESVSTDFGRGDVEVLQARKPYSGFFNVEELDLSFRRFDGSMSEPVSRAILIGVDCAIVLPYDPVRDRVLVIEQFRPGAYLRGDPNPWTVEPIAGRIDGGEEPEKSARREALEEAGVTLGEMHCVAAAYPSPGSTTELFFTYVGLTDLPDDAGGTGGKLSEAEDIRSHVMEWAAFDASLTAGKFRLMPMFVAGLWLARNRDRLRASA